MLILVIPSLILAYLVYSLIPAKHLNGIPTVPVIPFLYSLLTGESSDKRIRRLVAPLLYKHGVAKFWLNRWIVVISDADKAKEMFTKTAVYTKQRIITNPHSLNKKFTGDNIVFSSGEEWRRHRKVSNPAFHRSWSTDKVGNCIEKIFNQIGTTNDPIEVLPLFKRMTLDALGKAIFNFDFNAVEDPHGKYVVLYEDILDGLFNPIFTLFPFLDSRYLNLRHKLSNKINEFRGLIKDVLNKKKKILQSETEIKEEDMDLLTMMVKATLEDKDDGPKLTEKEIIDDACTFFIAGHDTTANTLSFIFYHLSLNPVIQQKARDEARKVMGESDIPNQDQLKEMHYITAIIHEAMRIDPTVQQLIRQTTKEIEVAPGVIVPANQTVAIDLYTMLHDERYWKNPRKFDPERFMKYTPNDKGELVGEFDKTATKAWYAFGGGPRTCIGINFSLMEQRMAIAMTLNQFEISLPGGPKYSDNPLKCNTNGIIYPIDMKVKFNKL